MINERHWDPIGNSGPGRIGQAMMPGVRVQFAYWVGLTTFDQLHLAGMADTIASMMNHTVLRNNHSPAGPLRATASNIDFYRYDDDTTTLSRETGPAYALSKARNSRSAHRSPCK